VGGRGKCSASHISDRGSPGKGPAHDSAQGGRGGGACGAAGWPLERQSSPREGALLAMEAIAAIVVFLVGFLALNRYEYGRFD
jgi:hypothetical protein